MKILITGANGTVGNAMKNYLQSMNIEVVCWDRKKVSPFNYNEMEEFLKTEKPDILFHFAIASSTNNIENESWKINYEWTSELAWITAQLGIKFLFTSTAMVFTDYAKGPFTVNTPADAHSYYGYEKKMAEIRAVAQNENTYIARLGWQISDNLENNNMVAYFEKEYKNKGVIQASSKWYPACSFVEDTVKELYRIVTNEKPGLYMVDSNDRYNFFQIAQFLKKIYKKQWKIEETTSFTFEQRMVDLNVRIEKLSFLFKNLELAEKNTYKDGESFHTNKEPIFTGKDGSHFKKDSEMAKVKYSPIHYNNKYRGTKRGIGNGYVKWVYSEQNETAENIVSPNLTMFHDTFIEPFSSVGFHKHTEDDEIYYILEGDVRVFLTDINEKQITKTLTVGDSHIVKKGESHYIESGRNGARFIVVGIK